jgi:hypothetical protein
MLDSKLPARLIRALGCSLERSIMKTIILLLLICTSASSQTQDSLRAKYGKPVSETFKARPGINVNVTYSSTGEAREMIIAPELPDTPIKSSMVTIDNELVRGIIDELVPLKERGKYLMGTFLNITCLPKNDCAGSSEDYEKLTIYYNAGKGGVNYAVIQWKK